MEPLKKLIKIPDTSNGGPLAEKLIYDKHQEYTRGARRNRRLYYTTRVVAGLCAGLLPFVVASAPSVATLLSIVIVVATVFDFVFSPKDKWQLFSRAADLLAIESLRKAGEYDEYKAMLEVLMATENAKLERLVNLDDLIAKIGTPAAKPT